MRIPRSAPLAFLFITFLPSLLHAIDPEAFVWPSPVSIPSNLPFGPYLSRCQSILQTGQSDNDLLLYSPTLPNPLDSDLSRYLDPTFSPTAVTLRENGYSFDTAPDHLLLTARAEHGQIILGNNHYRALIIPPVQFLPPSIIKKLPTLAAPILYTSSTSDLLTSLAQSRIPRESLADTGLHFIRRSYSRGYYYFLFNPTSHPIDAWLPLATPAAAAIILDPQSQDHIGTAAVRHRGPSAEIYLQLSPGQSLALRTFTSIQPSGPVWKYFQPFKPSLPLSGPWQATHLPSSTRYSTDFDTPSTRCSDWLLDLGPIHTIATVTLNNHQFEPLCRPPYSLHIGTYLAEGSNHLDIDLPIPADLHVHLIPLKQFDPAQEDR
ncbi:MAG TPA: hypothetical protein VFE58_03160 [Tepidisphaeraceae bacterium]|jgi:hypothetical protein|nr:hypothetical protein [Tepidisphaeraceae bacterium]